MLCVCVCVRGGGVQVTTTNIADYTSGPWYLDPMQGGHIRQEIGGLVSDPMNQLAAILLIIINIKEKASLKKADFPHLYF